MASLVFRRRTGNGLYAADCPTPATTARVWYLLAAPPGVAPDEIPLERTWNDPAVRGAYVVAPEPADAPAFAAALRERILEREGRCAWVATPDARPLDAMLLCANAEHRTVGESVLALRDMALVVGSDNRLTIDLGTAEITLAQGALAGADPGAANGTGEYVATPYATTPDAEVPARTIAVRAPGGADFRALRAPVRLALCGAQAGLLRTSVQLDAAALQAFGGDIRYARQHDEALTVHRFPVFAPGEDGLVLDAQLDLLLPDDAARTRFDFRATTPATYRSAFRTPAGRIVTLTPRPDARLVLAPMPAPGGAATRYLAPCGSFAVGYASPSAAGDRELSPFADVTADAVVCGLSGAEFLQLDAGDLLDFGLPAAAYAPAIAPERDGPLLTDREGTARTPWLGITPSRAHPDFGYYVQPASAVYYGRAVAAEELCLQPCAVHFSNLDVSPGNGSGARAYLPIAPYGGIPAQSEEATEAIEALELDVLAPERRRRAPVDPAGPRFVTPVGAMLRAGLDAPAERAVTPQGLIAELGEAGSWRAVELARDDDGHRLAFTGEAGAPLAAALADALLTDDLFLVASRKEKVGALESVLSMGGFTFDAQLAAADAPLGAVILLKFTGGTIADLVEQPSRWSGAKVFNAAQPPMDMSNWLREYIALAERAAEEGDTTLQPFAALVRDPSWMGVLALNCRVGGRGVPEDLRALLGGMSEPLVGHHVGVQVNQIDVPAGAPPVIGRSALFGLVRYPPLRPGLTLYEEPPAYDFVVHDLRARFADSALAEFHSLVGLTLNRLFGRDAIREGGEGNELALHGTWQREDGVDSFLFAMAEPASFTLDGADVYPRVVSRVTVASASFETVSSEPQGKEGALKVTGAFRLAGSMAFAATPFPGVAMDLFGYGPEAPLDFTDAILDYSLLLDANGEVVPESRTPLVFRAKQLRFPAPPVPRKGSLPGGLPVTLCGFYANEEEGLNASGLAAKPVQVPQLLGNAVTAPESRGYFTSEPLYALDFTLPLGTLGDMSSVHVAFVAHLLVAWGPNPAAPDEDAAAILIQLPAVTPGYQGMSLQGILRTTFGDASLTLLDGVYTLLFNNVALSVFSFTLPPGVVLDLLVFSDPKPQGAPSVGNLGWFLSYAK